MIKITNHTTGEVVEIAKKDLSKPLDWYKATKKADILGDGWRLPTKIELKIIYEQLSEIHNHNFSNVIYWSSTNDEEDDDYAYGFRFDDGETYWNSKSALEYVRFVRTL
jgi:hypothetical protein